MLKSMSAIFLSKGHFPLQKGIGKNKWRVTQNQTQSDNAETFISNEVNSD